MYYPEKFNKIKKTKFKKNAAAGEHISNTNQKRQTGERNSKNNSNNNDERE